LGSVASRKPIGYRTLVSRRQGNCTGVPDRSVGQPGANGIWALTAVPLTTSGQVSRDGNGLDLEAELRHTERADDYQRAGRSVREEVLPDCTCPRASPPDEREPFLILVRRGRWGVLVRWWCWRGTRRSRR